MKILIIGSEGFIGRNAARYLFNKGYEIHGCDVVEREGNAYSRVDALNPDFNIVFSQALPDICINASGSADVGFSIRNPEVDYRLNVENVRRMLEAIRLSGLGCKFLNFSSAAVYGNPEVLPVSESARISPLSPYGRHKLESEQLLERYFKDYGVPTLSMRVFSAYGTGLKKQLFWDIYQKTLAGKNIRLFGTGKESRDFIFIDDLVRTIEIIFQKGKFQGGAINVSSGIETTIGDAATRFLSFLNDDFQLEFSGEEKAGDPKNWRADITQLKALGFTPMFSFDRGIKQYAEWLKEGK